MEIHTPQYKIAKFNWKHYLWNDEIQCNKHFMYEGKITCQPQNEWCEPFSLSLAKRQLRVGTDSRQGRHSKHENY